MPNTEEQRLDVIDSCNQLLDGILKPFGQSDDTPEGRMITQLKWIKERSEKHDHPLPVDHNNLSTLCYVYTDGELCRDTSNPQDPTAVWIEVERQMDQLLNLTKHARLLIKPLYYPYAFRMITALSNILNNPGRPLNENEQGMISELRRLKQLLTDGKTELPLMSYLPEYPSFRKVYRLTKSSIDDLPNGKYLCQSVANLIFEGIRPDTWLTPEDADIETQKL